MVRRRSGFAGALCWSLIWVVVTLSVQYFSDGGGITAQWPFTRSAYAGGAWWQLLSAQWVHLGWMHAGVNALGLVVLLRAFARLVDGRLQALALLGGYAGVALVLALDSHCDRYAGASGALHGLLAGNALALLFTFQGAAQATRARRVVGALLLAALAVKLGWQHPVSGAAAVPGWLGFATYYPAHEAGALGGCVAILLALGGGARRSAQSPGRP